MFWQKPFAAAGTECGVGFFPRLCEFDAMETGFGVGGDFEC